MRNLIIATAAVFTLGITAANAGYCSNGNEIRGNFNAMEAGIMNCTKAGEGYAVIRGSACDKNYVVTGGNAKKVPIALKLLKESSCGKQAGLK